MSASREKKNRQAFAASGAIDPKAARAAEEKAQQRKSRLLYGSIAVIFVIVAVLVLLWNSNVFQRNATALTAEQLQGYQLFKDNTCATCHVGKTLGGQSFEYLGIFEDYFAARAQEHPDVQYNDDDKGLAGFTGRDEDLHKFKVPSLRNISKTAPYFHDGTMPTIEDAVKGMFRYELGRTATDEETQKISAFLRALDGEQRWN